MNTKKFFLKQIIPLSLQHVLAMFIGTIVPPLLIANIINAPAFTVTMLIQAALLSSALATFIQIFPIKIFRSLKTGSSLPLMMGMNYVFLGICLSVVDKHNLSTLFGGLFLASIIFLFFNNFILYFKKFFTPLISGILIICMGIGLFQPAINNLAGGYGHPSYGNPQNFLLGISVSLLIIFLNKFAKGIVKDSSILIGILVGYIFSFFLGIIDFSQVGNSPWISWPKPIAYGFDFNIEVISIFLIAYIISTIDFMGCCTLTTVGGLNRNLESLEYSNGTIGCILGSILGAVFGSIPVAGLSQNAAIVSLNKNTHKLIFIMASIFIFFISLSPKLATILITIPNSVIGGATLVIFGMIVTSGISLLTMDTFTDEDKLIAGFSIALSIGLSHASNILSKFPEIIQTLIGGSTIVTGVVTALFLQTIFSTFKTSKDSNLEEKALKKI